MNKSSTTDPDLEKQLTTACRGLVYVSETDSPVVPFFGTSSPIAKDSEIAFDKFFDRLTSKKEWHTRSDRENAERFAKLKALLKSELEDLHIYKTGEIQIEITIVGRTKGGQFAGVKMKAIET